MELKATSNLPFEGDFDEMIRAFSPYATVGTESDIHIEYSGRDDFWRVKLIAPCYELEEKVVLRGNVDIKRRAQLKKKGKTMLYDYISEVTGIELPYGSLTGIRPTKLMREIMKKGQNAMHVFVHELRVQPDVAQAVWDIVHNQQDIYLQDSGVIDLFVNIPICVTRCSYCSFISAELGKITKWVQPYVAQLIREIEHAKAMIQQKGLVVRGIYVGGGTPTSLSEEDFDAIMQALKGLDCVEFTVEAGRPDTISKAKLDSMQRVGVSRISINPQSFDDDTLLLIGRSHTAKEIVDTYHLARQYSMDINMDLIAMLPSEGLETFQKSVLKAIELQPDNITVHTLALKKGSSLRENHYVTGQVELATQMIDFSKKALTNAGYMPYYMYKQKYMSGSLENTGYCKVSKACIYNIDIMEESLSILACGAGGISKRVFQEDEHLERLANPKGIDVYLERESIILEQKEKFFE